MKHVFFCLMLLISINAIAQTETKTPAEVFVEQKLNPITEVKNQAMTGTCWCFSTTSLVESQCLKNKLGNFDLSEMFIVRNIYIEKAKNYVLRVGHAQFGEGGLGHDLIRAIDTYGAMPESVYSGLPANQKMFNHSAMVASLQQYLDSIIKKLPLPSDWLKGYISILDNEMGVTPEKFDYNGKTYTPKSFAMEVLKFSANDYVNITSFTHQPFYQPFILQVPDNFSNGYYYNLPLAEMLQLTKTALKENYSIMWDADVSNKGFMQGKGLALFINENMKIDKNKISASMTENPWDADLRQKLYENLTTQDDHLMHIYGIEKSADGKDFFVVKNSWGKVGPFEGNINVSEAYFAMNTVSLVIPKAALSKSLLDKLKITK